MKIRLTTEVTFRIKILSKIDLSDIAIQDTIQNILLWNLWVNVHVILLDIITFYGQLHLLAGDQLTGPSV